jgi:Ni,Fe-hydrogenase I large subunit
VQQSRFQLKPAQRFTESDISEKYEKQLDTERAVFKDRHEADFKSQQVLMDERESELKKNISQLSINYQRKIDKMIVENETKLKLITNEYETKLQDERTLSNKERSQKDSLHMGEVTRLKENFEKEKRRLVNTYEGQIETIRNSHKQQLNQINDYKRLS